MKQKLTTEILEAEHDIPGFGKIVIDYTFGDGHYKYKIKSDSMGSEIVYTGDKAKKYGEKIFKNDFSRLTPYQVKLIACDACHVPTQELNSRTRKEEYVFARYLCTWYFYNYSRMTKTGAGAEVGIDHATTMRGIKMIQSYIEDEMSYNGLKPATKQWFTEFMKQIKK